MLFIIITGFLLVNLGFWGSLEKWLKWVPKSRFSGIGAQTRNFKTRSILWYRSGGSPMPDMLQKMSRRWNSEVADGRKKKLVRIEYCGFCIYANCRYLLNLYFGGVKTPKKLQKNVKNTKKRQKRQKSQVTNKKLDFLLTREPKMLAVDGASPGPGHHFRHLGSKSKICL